MDGCDKTCQGEAGFVCSGGSVFTKDSCLPVCGDGLRVGTTTGYSVPSAIEETCDVGQYNPQLKPGCSRSCKTLPGWSCSYNLYLRYDECSPVCGDGKITGSEECDDANLQDGDGCTQTCLVEALYECSRKLVSDVAYPGQQFNQTDSCKIACGDGLLESGGEECDDGNIFSGDGCTGDCKTERGFLCSGGTVTSSSKCAPRCGDGYQVWGESCDDGNAQSGDGCSGSCQVGRDRVAHTSHHGQPRSRTSSELILCPSRCVTSVR